MSKDKNPNTSSGMGFFATLFMVFLVLKLTDVIAWSWWWVTAPLWGGALLIFIVACATAALLFNKDLYQNERGKTDEQGNKQSYFDR